MKTELNEAVTLAPGFADATLLLADLNIQSGAVQPAIKHLERFLARQPNARWGQVLQSNTPAAASCCSPRDSARPSVAQSTPRGCVTAITGSPGSWARRHSAQRGHPSSRPQRSAGSA